MVDTAAALRSALARGGELPERPGVTGVVDLAVTGGPGGDVHVTLTVTDGRLTAAAPGTPETADLSLTLPAGDAAGVAGGGVAPSVAFMRGRLKTAGDNGLLLGLLAQTAEAPFTRWLDDLGKA